MKNLIFTILIASLSAGCLFAQNTSKYTDLRDTKCKTIELQEDEGGTYKGECPGVAGYKLNLVEGDLRQTIDIIDPSGKEHPLKFWELFGDFSAVGDKAEWRMKGNKPIALIVRLNVNENPEQMEKRTSYLIVAKITDKEVCVTDTLKPTRSHNAEARIAADKSAARPCRK